ncbi:MAG: HupE/UreJ family protein [Rhodoferax sp.]
MAPLWVSAHTGANAGAHHPAGFLDGFLHPLTGPDHLAAMLAVGCWSALAARRLWQAPLAFAGMLLVGALAGLSGLAVPAVEPAIAASLLVLGLLVATRARMPGAAAMALVGAFAIFHGVAHGAELAGDGQAWAPLAGMLLATVGLHLAGLGLGLLLRARNAWWPRSAGGAVALLGLVLLARMV